MLYRKITMMGSIKFLTNEEFLQQAVKTIWTNQLSETEELSLTIVNDVPAIPVILLKRSIPAISTHNLNELLAILHTLAKVDYDHVIYLGHNKIYLLDTKFEIPSFKPVEDVNQILCERESFDWYFLAGSQVNGQVFRDFSQLAKVLISSVKKRLTIAKTSNLFDFSITIGADKIYRLEVSYLVTKRLEDHFCIAVEEGNSIQFPHIPKEIYDIFEEHFVIRGNDALDLVLQTLQSDDIYEATLSEFESIETLSSFNCNQPFRILVLRPNEFEIIRTALALKTL